MNHSGDKEIYRRLSERRFEPRHAAEVGVWRLHESNISDYIERGVRCTLVEPAPDALESIEVWLGGWKNVTLHSVAVGDVSGEIAMFRRGPSTFVADLPTCPAVMNDRYVPDDSDRFIASAVTFDRIDDGSIDLLSVDTEGCEWYVLKHMVSRPVVISLETHFGRYSNPFIRRIRHWMRVNGYRLWYKDHSDSVFVKPEVIRVRPRDRWRLFAANLRLLSSAIKLRTISRGPIVL